MPIIRSQLTWLMNANLRAQPKGLNSLLHCPTPQSWLLKLLDYIDLINTQESSFLFKECNYADLQKWQQFFIDSSFVNALNAVFYFKLHPEQLFDSKLSSEKLLSIRTRLENIYQSIERIQQQLLLICKQNSLSLTNDYLFHGEELPQGVVINVPDAIKNFLQTVVKKYKPACLPAENQRAVHIKLYDLCRAYKFWFNPNRLIDAVMVLQQVFQNKTLGDTFDEVDFRKKMYDLFKTLKTTECLDLYGYFANKDTGYLLRTLNAIAALKSWTWLPPLGGTERQAIFRVFQALSCCMEALRDELACRSIITEDYPFDFSKAVKNPGRRNRNAVLRIIALYGKESHTANRSMEHLFHLVESPEADEAAS